MGVAGGLKLLSLMQPCPVSFYAWFFFSAIMNFIFKATFMTVIKKDKVTQIKQHKEKKKKCNRHHQNNNSDNKLLFFSMKSVRK